jgi:hypothetical protein
MMKSFFVALCVFAASVTVYGNSKPACNCDCSYPAIAVAQSMLAAKGSTMGHRVTKLNKDSLTVRAENSAQIVYAVEGHIMDLVNDYTILVKFYKAECNLTSVSIEEKSSIH